MTSARDLSQGSSPSRPGGARRARLRGLLVLPLVLLLCACAVVDPLKRETCIAVLPAIEAAGARITLLSAEADPARAENVRLVYRVDDRHGRRENTLVCAFDHDATAPDGRSLVGVRTERGVLSDARFYMLKRFWLGDPRTRDEALTRVAIAGSAEPRGLLSLSEDAAVALQRTIDATAPASLYALLALACSLIWGLVGRVNFAFGDLAMLGAYGALVGALLGRAIGFSAVGPILALAILLALAVGAGWGAVLGRTVFAPLAFRSAQPLLIATVGLSIALQEFVARAQGARDLFLVPMLETPRLVADGPFTVLVTPMRLFVVAVTLAAVLAVLFVFPRTRWGREWHAVADDPVMARLLGIDPVRVLVLTFAVASALAALAGAVPTLAYGGTNFHMGTVLGLKGIVAAVLGGIGSLPGAALGGLTLGLAETVWAAVFGLEWRDAGVLALLAGFLILRPGGLMGTADPAPRHDRRG